MLFVNKKELPLMMRHHFLRLSGYIVLWLLSIAMCRPVVASSPPVLSGPASSAALQVVEFCADPKVGFDGNAAATVADYVLSLKQTRVYELPKAKDCTGAYHEFDVKVTLPRFIEYSYNPQIPPAVTRPSSLRYSTWTSPRDLSHKFPNSWEPVAPSAAPVVIHAMQRECDTPDLNSGVYHEYDLKRTLVLFNHKGRQVLFSISKQIDKSNVGKKGFILGDDTEWAYYYSGEPGTPKTGLGWVKSYIYDYFSVGVYAESDTTPGVVRAAVFQWLSAGWIGTNFVKTAHILRGLERFARDCKLVLESPRLPASNQIVSAYQRLSTMPAPELMKRYSALQQAVRSKAAKMGKVKQADVDEQVSYANIPREQIMEELMLEYLKTSIDNAPLVKEQF